MKPLTRTKRWRYRCEVALVEGLVHIFSLFPRRFIHGLGRAVGWLGYYLMRQDRRIALANLDVAYGATQTHAEKTALARASFQNFGATFLTFFWTPRLRATTLADFVEFDEASLQRVRELQARGKGILFVTLHYGDWELMAQATGYRGIPLTIVMEQMRNHALGDVFARLRGQAGHRVIFQRGAATKLFKALKRGECVAMLIDLNGMLKLGGVWVDFFGLPVFNHSAPAALALRTGAALVVGVAQPLPGGRVRIVYHPEIPCVPTGNESADIQTVSQACATFCEQVIRAEPRHWLWSYKRWKFQKDAATDRYPFYARHVTPRGAAAVDTGRG